MSKRKFSRLDLAVTIQWNQISPAHVCPRNQEKESRSRTRRTKGRFMVSHLSLLRTYWDHEPSPHPPFGHPLPLGGGEGRGEGAVHGGREKVSAVRG